MKRASAIAGAMIAALWAQTAPPRLALQEVPLKAPLNLGTVSSIAQASDGTVYVFHRGADADPVIAMNTEGRLLRSWGKGMFTVPHSIRIDPDGNIWTVDAGDSVLRKFSPQGVQQQEISVGEVATGERCAFPTLCGATDVAFGPNGRLYISDGYGNARVLEYNSRGERVRVWGSPGTGPGQFQIPHGIAVAGNIVYVADRTNARIQRFDLDGRYLGEWTHLGRPFALKSSGGALWVAAMTLDQPPRPLMQKVDLAAGTVLGQIQAPGPHAIDVNASEELFGTGCCGGTGATNLSWLRRGR